MDPKSNEVIETCETDKIVKLLASDRMMNVLFRFYRYKTISKREKNLGNESQKRIVANFLGRKQLT